MERILDWTGSTCGGSLVHLYGVLTITSGTVREATVGMLAETYLAIGYGDRRDPVLPRGDLKR